MPKEVMGNRIQNMMFSDTGAPVEANKSYIVGDGSNPGWPVTAAAASLTAADMLYDGQASRIFNPSGGTHYGCQTGPTGFVMSRRFFQALAPSAAAGKRRGSERLPVIDIDAHHPDGAQAHLSGDERVRLWSVHEANKWPRTGPAGDTGNGFARNFTLQRGAGDDQAAMGWIKGGIMPELTSFNPDWRTSPLEAG